MMENMEIVWDRPDKEHVGNPMCGELVKRSVFTPFFPLPETTVVTPAAPDMAHKIPYTPREAGRLQKIINCHFHLDCLGIRWYENTRTDGSEQYDMEPSEEVIAEYDSIRQLPDGRLIGVKRLLFHWTLHIDIHEIGYEDSYCYTARDQAVEAMAAWDGSGDPGGGWHRHPKSGRRRPDGDPAKEFVRF